MDGGRPHHRYCPSSPSLGWYSAFAKEPGPGDQACLRNRPRLLSSKRANVPTVCVMSPGASGHTRGWGRHAPGASGPRRATLRHTSKPWPVPVHSAGKPPSTCPLHHLPTSGLSLYTPSSRKPSLAPWSGSSAPCLCSRDPGHSLLRLSVHLLVSPT